MLSIIKNDNVIHSQYVATCAFTDNKFLITPEAIFVEFGVDGSMFVIAYVGKKLIFSQQCLSLHLLDKNFVKQLPKIKLKPK